MVVLFTLLVSLTSEKIERYGVISQLMNLQVAAGSSSRSSVVVPAVLSHRGEMCIESLDLVEHLTLRFKGSQKHVFCLYGLSVSQRVGIFRNDFKSSLMTNLFSSTVGCVSSAIT